VSAELLGDEQAQEIGTPQQLSLGKRRLAATVAFYDIGGKLECNELGPLDPFLVGWIEV
jgi:hypothetical protein